MNGAAETTLRRGKARDKPRVPQQPVVRVAIYTRKSVTEGLEQEFNTLDAQREAIEAYVTSQRSLGWKALETRYDDGGFSGANTDRPAFQRLLADVNAGLIDVVAVYKFDRLSRRQIDFLRTMELLDEQKVGFVSVTQNLDTSTSMGRCMMNVMSAFAQLEREVISERTKDKMLASRRKGMWTGGRPILGYDVVDKKLVINEEEAERVRETFKLYLERGSLLAVVKELKARGWKNKTWTNKAGDQVQGGKLNKVGLSNLLKNPLYIGKVRAGGELVDGQHMAIIAQETFDAVAKQLETNTGNRGASTQRSAAKGGNVLLAGLDRCAPCGSAMTNHHTKKGNRRYAYYVCTKHQKEGAAACPGSRAAAGELGRFVLEQIREIGRHPKLLEATIEADKRDRETKRPALEADLRKLTAEVARTERKRDNLVESVAANGSEQPGLLKGIEALEEELVTTQAKTTATRRELEELDSDAIDPEELRKALDQLDPLWEELFPAEKARLLDLLIERIDFDGGEGVVEITFRRGGPELLQESAEQ